jgi:hypothetical protein
MKKLILAMSIVASCAASATDIVLSWTSPAGGKYTYHLDTESARKMGVSDDIFWTMKIAVEDDKGVIVATANSVADGCDLAAPAGTAAIVDDEGKLMPGTGTAEWTLAAFAAGHGKIVDAIASYTCIAAMANELAASRKKPAVHMESMEYFMQHI